MVDVLLVAAGVVVGAFGYSLLSRHEPDRTDSPDEPIRVQVLNACGRDKAASAVAAVLGRGLCDVVITGNADTSGLALTYVADHEDAGGANARYVAALLGLPPGRARVEPLAHNDLNLAATVYVGLDRAGDTLEAR